MKYLILGSRGNLGSALMSLASTRPEIKMIGWDSTEVDITDFILLQKKINKLKPDVIINTVAYNRVDECEVSEEAYLEARLLNVETVKKLGEMALANSATLITYSSDYVFGGSPKENNEGYDENSITSPLNRYGMTKVEGEKELVRLSGKGLDYYIIRTSKLFGPKADSPAAKPGFFEIMKNKALEKEVRVVDGEKSCFTYTPDLAEASLQLLEESLPVGFYHLINTGPVTWYEAVKYFYEKIGAQVDLKPISPQELDRPAKRAASSILLNTKRPPLRSWQEALDEYLSL